MLLRATAFSASVKVCVPLPVTTPRLLAASTALLAPVPPAMIGRGAFRSVSTSATLALYFVLSIVVSATALVPGGLVYIPLPSRGIGASYVLRLRARILALWHVRQLRHPCGVMYVFSGVYLCPLLQCVRCRCFLPDASPPSASPDRSRSLLCERTSDSGSPLCARSTITSWRTPDTSRRSTTRYVSPSTITVAGFLRLRCCSARVAQRTLPGP